MKRAIVLSLVLWASVGCQTFHFENGETGLNEDYKTEEFHHIGVVQLVEFSGPVKPTEICDGKEWSKVRTRKGPLQVLVRIFAGPVYGPEETAVSCKQ